MEQAKQKKKKSWELLLALSLAALIISASVLISSNMADAEEESEFEALAKNVSDEAQSISIANTEEPEASGVDETSNWGEPSPTDGANATATDAPESSKKGMLPQYAALYKKNPDMGGWIRIDFTNINYPVMFTPDNPEKYLHLSFDGKYSARGVPFVGESCTTHPRSENIVVYGHHMKNGSMFAGIVNYKDMSFCREHPVICFSTLYEEGKYEAVAVIETDIYAARKLRCYTFANAENKEDFDEYISGIKKASLYDTGVNAEYGDKLLTLSTCSYQTMDGRFLVIAKKISG